MRRILSILKEYRIEALKKRTAPEARLVEVADDDRWPTAHCRARSSTKSADSMRRKRNCKR
jgi:hypothetical protein